jgi:hypothetical protein
MNKRKLPDVIPHYLEDFQACNGKSIHFNRNKLAVKVVR